MHELDISIRNESDIFIIQQPITHLGTSHGTLDETCAHSFHYLLMSCWLILHHMRHSSARAWFYFIFYVHFLILRSRIQYFLCHIIVCIVFCRVYMPDIRFWRCYIGLFQTNLYVRARYRCVDGMYVVRTYVRYIKSAFLLSLNIWLLKLCIKSICGIASGTSICIV